MKAISAATQYFVAYWEDLWHGVSAHRDLLTSFNPRIVVKELLDEISQKKQRNKLHEEFFERTLGGYLSHDPGTQARVKPLLQMIVQEFDLSALRPAYREQLCRSVLKQFATLHYFEDSVDALVEVLNSTSLTSATKAAIQSITNHLIVELRELGYTEKEIERIPRCLFAEVRKTDDGLAYWEYPHSIECGDLEAPGTAEEYERALRAQESTLTEEDRIRALLTFAHRSKQPFRYIFRVNGMSGTEEVETGAVLFYAPAKKRLLRSDRERSRDYELFRAPADSPSINAAVTVSAVTAVAGEAMARAKVEQALAFCRRAMDGETTLWVSRSYLALREDGSLAASSHHAFERRDDDWTKVFKLDLANKDRIDRLLGRLDRTRAVAIKNGWANRFDKACYWLRKAEESASYVDQLLFYWICIESLCSKSEGDSRSWFQTTAGKEETGISVIKEVVGKMRAVAKCYEHGWAVHNELSPQITQRLLSLPSDVIRDAQLNVAEGEQVHLINLVNTCDRIESALPDGLLKDHVAELRAFYGDKSAALNTLRRHLRVTQDELTFIYRMRNRIAHDGNSDEPILPWLCTLAAKYALTLFHRIGYFVEKRGEVQLNSILICAVQEYERIQARLKIEGPVAVLLESDV